MVALRLVTIALAALVLTGAFPKLVMSQSISCNCDPTDDCCDEWWFCGIGELYCGWPTCQEGPCYPPPPTNNVSLADIITDEFFDGIIKNNSPECEGNGFYTREYFLEAAAILPVFCRIGNESESRRELAAFFAIASQVTSNLCYVESSNQSDFCNLEFNTTYPCYPDVKYYGRGALRLTWNYNYGDVAKRQGLRILKFPDLVHEDPLLSFVATMSYWIFRLRKDYQISFGYLIKNAIPEACDGTHPESMEATIAYFKDYCDQFGVDPGDNLRC